MILDHAEYSELHLVPTLSQDIMCISGFTTKLRSLISSRYGCWS